MTLKKRIHGAMAPRPVEDLNSSENPELIATAPVCGWLVLPSVKFTKQTCIIFQKSLLSNWVIEMFGIFLLR